MDDFKLPQWYVSYLELEAERDALRAQNAAQAAALAAFKQQGSPDWLQLAQEHVAVSHQRNQLLVDQIAAMNREARLAAALARIADAPNEELRGGRHLCPNCGHVWWISDPEHHSDKCPKVIARAARDAAVVGVGEGVTDGTDHTSIV